MKKLFTVLLLSISLLFIGCTDDNSSLSNFADNLPQNGGVSSSQSENIPEPEPEPESIPEAESMPNIDSAVTIENCLYALNEVYSERFSAEFYDTADMTKKAVYESEDAYYDSDVPALLLGENEPTPSGYYDDPAVVAYYPISNFTDKADINEHFSLYFTQRYIEDMQWRLDENFLEFEGALYLERGGRGYGMRSVDFDSVDPYSMQDNTLIIDLLSFGEFDGKYLVTFAEEDGTLKLDSENYLLMYDLINVSPTLEGIEVPDFRALATGNELPTASNEFMSSTSQEDKHVIGYTGVYYDFLPRYVKLFELLGFTVIMDGYEGFYSYEKYEGDYTLTVNVYYMNETDGVVVEIIKQGAVG